MPLDLSCAVLTNRRSSVQVPRQDFVVSRGDDAALELTVWPDDYADTPTDLTGCAAVLTLVRRCDDRECRWGWDYGYPLVGYGGYGNGGEVVAQFAGVVADDPTTGRIDIPLPMEATELLIGRYEFILDYAPFGDAYFCVLRGVLDVLPCPVVTPVFGVVSIAPGTLAPGPTPAPVSTPQPNYALLDSGVPLGLDGGGALLYDGLLPDVTMQPPTPQVATFVVSITPVGRRPAYVDWITVDGTATAAAGDYTPESGTVTFPKGANSVAITVPVRPLTSTKLRSRFGVRLLAARGASLGAVVLGTVDIPGTFIIGQSLLDGGDLLA